MNPSPELQAALDGADEAAHIIRKFYQHNAKVTIKADKSPVTEADVACEHAIKKIIETRFPDHGFYGEETGKPLTIHIEANRITKVSSPNKKLEKDFWAYTHTDANSDRVGEFAIGTNIGVSRVIGNILQDEKFPGIHIAFGDPYGAHTGAKWKSSTHIDVVGLRFSIWLGNADGEEQIMRDGDFLIHG